MTQLSENVSVCSENVSEFPKNASWFSENVSQSPENVTLFSGNQDTFLKTETHFQETWTHFWITGTHFWKLDHIFRKPGLLLKPLLELIINVWETRTQYHETMKLGYILKNLSHNLSGRGASGRTTPLPISTLPQLASMRLARKYRGTSSRDTFCIMSPNPNVFCLKYNILPTYF